MFPVQCLSQILPAGSRKEQQCFPFVQHRRSSLSLKELPSAVRLYEATSFTDSRAAQDREVRRCFCGSATKVCVGYL